MNAIGIAILVIGALVVGYGYRYIGQNREGYGTSLATAIGAGAGGLAASEWLGTLSTWGPEADGLFLLPALIGGLIVGGVVEAAIRQLSRPEPVGHTAH